MKLTGHYDELQGHLLKPVDNPKCQETNAGLYERLVNAVPLSEQLMKEFDAYLDGAELNERFNRNFE